MARRGTAWTDLQVIRIARFGMKPRIGQDNHAVDNLADEGVKMGVVHVGGGTVPATNQPP
jgi:hypothetical protein